MVSLLPALVIIIFTALTQRVALGVFLGMSAGAVILGWGSLSGVIGSVWKTLFLCFSDAERLKIALFIVLTGGLLEIVSGTGAFHKLADLVRERLSSARRTRLGTFFLGIAVFFDDYSNLLLSGASMRNISRSHGISPGLSAYIADQCAVVVSLMMVSTWSAFEGSLLVGAAERFKLPYSATQLFVQSFPYHALTYLGILLAFISAWTGNWIGARLDDLGSVPDKSQPAPQIAGIKVRHFVVPFTVFLSITLIGMTFYGIRNLRTIPWPEMNVMRLFENVPTVDMLLIGIGAALVVGIGLIRRNGALGWGEMGKAFRKAAKDMASAAFVIIFSKGLSEVSAELGTGTYVTGLLGGWLSPVLLGPILAAAAFLITVATGFSWSSMAITMPIAFQMAMSQGGEGLLPLASGAVISGAIAGGLLIPYSDTTVMAAVAYGIPPTYHAKTQSLQVLATVFASAVSLALLGAGWGLVPGYLAGAVLLVSVHFAAAGSGMRASTEVRS